MPFYASLAHGVDFHMRELDGTRSSASQDVLHISKLLKSDREHIFLELLLLDLRGPLVFALHTHTLNKYVIRSAHKIFILGFIEKVSSYTHQCLKHHNPSTICPFVGKH